MARFKNALIKHFVQPFSDEIDDDKWFRLAKYITNVEDDSEEEVEDVAYYDGDGNLSSDVNGYKESYKAEGTYDPTDDAQKLIASMKRELGEKRKVFYKQEHPDGLILQGPATVTEIKAGHGEASEFGTFECKITFDKRPEVLSESGEELEA